MKELENFISYFPEVELPVILSDDSLTLISATNDVIPAHYLSQFVGAWEANLESEFIEIVPCFKLTLEDKKVNSLVYWKGDILKYEFILVTFDEGGKLIDRKVLCGTLVEGSIIKKSVANIDIDKIIHIVASAYDTSSGEFSPASSQNFAMEIMPNGEIVFMKE
jgi:hypothetical protein